MDRRQSRAKGAEPETRPPDRSRLRFRRRLLTIALMTAQVLADAISLNGALLLSYWLLQEDVRTIFAAPTESEVQWALTVFNLLFAGTFWANGLYHLRRGASRIDELYGIVRAISLGTVLGIAANTVFELVGVTNQVVVLAWALMLSFDVILRMLFRTVLSSLRARGFDNRRLILVGASGVGRFVLEQLRRSKDLGYRVVGFLTDSHEMGAIVDDVPVLGTRSQLPEIVRQQMIDEVIVATNNASYNEVLELAALVDDRDVGIKIYPDLFHIMTSDVSVGELSGLPLVSLRTVPLDQGFNRAVKRLMDVAIAGTMLVLMSPIMLALGILIRMESPGPVFFVQERVGLDGRPFKVLKFRSMRQDAERNAKWTTANDARRTRIGSFIRRYSLDELPQFINVLWGDMSIVGPRPEQPNFVEQFRQEIPSYMRRHREKAGITGWAQVNGLRGDTSIEERTRYDLYYIENWSPLFDLKIMLRTALIMLKGEAY